MGAERGGARGLQAPATPEAGAPYLHAVAGGRRPRRPRQPGSSRDHARRADTHRRTPGRPGGGPRLDLHPARRPRVRPYRDRGDDGVLGGRRAKPAVSGPARTARPDRGRSRAVRADAIREGERVTRYASLAAMLLRRARDRGAEAAPERDPARLVPAARLALAQRRSRLMFRKVGLAAVGLAAAAAVALAAGPWLHRGPVSGTPASRSSPHVFAILDTPASPVAGEVLGTGITLQAPPEAPVRIGSADGTMLTLEARGELSVVEQSATRRFALHKGAVRARVAHLHAGERFLIATADAEVEVHGTVFRVSLADGDPGCEDGRRTRVAVSEGVVSVRAGGRETLVAAGDVWPACARLTASRASDAAAGPARVTAELHSVSRRHARPDPAPPREPDGLAAAHAR